MEVFVNVQNEKIINFGTNESDESISIEANSFDSFMSAIKEYEPLTFEQEEEARELFEVETKEVNEMTLESFNIKHWISNRSFGELIDMYDSGEIVKPDMQRDFVWDSIKCSRLIESIILGLPIPPLFLLEVDKNKYEIIDGFQRLTALFNYVSGLPWNYSEEAKLKPRVIASKLSNAVSKEIAKKNFDGLTKEHQRIIKRSTIPLIEFKQLSPDNFESKYLIFERINTGSEKLNPMQIRKSLAYGTLMKDLYRYSEHNTKFKDIFSSSSRKKDVHIEAFLRIFVMIEVYISNFVPVKSGIKNILNEFCEKHREDNIPQEYMQFFNQAIDITYDVFVNKDKMFRRVEETGRGIYEFSGNLNVSIMESFIGTLIINLKQNNEINDHEKINKNYKLIMYSIIEESLITNNNPFTTSTGTINAIKKRFDYSKQIIGINNDDI